ncbi:MAG: tRNA (guanine(37)-N(1))-methyltransferase [Clostridiaceae bacterium]|jgi:tRNA (guanine37-N1)-methyltransferase|nr:tRNA (guanine(37)-N(1))-methyltransferase [Clostridiaceae bacterium]
MITFTLLSLFPEQVLDALQHSITGRALREGHIKIRPVQIRDFAINDYGQVDDAPYGGGRGMLMMCEPIYRAWEKARADILEELNATYMNSTRTDAQFAPQNSIETKGTPQNVSCDSDSNHSQALAVFQDLSKEVSCRNGSIDDCDAASCPNTQSFRTIFLSPKGRVFNQHIALELSKTSNVILLCGHYEGVDCRVLDAIGAEEVSIGDFILTGGELAAAVIIDAITRLIPGVLPDEDAWQRESFASHFLEEPQYTRPSEWRERSVPDVLLSGHAANIEKARRRMRLLETLKKRPDQLQGKKIDASLLEDLAAALLDE